MVGSEIVLPDEGTIARFIHDHNKYMAPFAIYADLESTTKEITPEEVESTDGSYTKKYQKHICNSFCLHVVSSFPEHSFEPIIYRARTETEDETKVIKRFLKALNKK